MIVYHYLNREYGLNSIQKRRLRISIVHKLKDPFEHRAILIDEEKEPSFEKMLEDMAKPDAMRTHGQGIICFSETCESPVMWSMYADNHEGLCLGFEIPDHSLYRVQYVKERVPMPKVGLDAMRACITHKFDDWRYEREHRLLIALQEDHRDEEHYFAYYEPNLALRTVAIGCRSTVATCEVNSALGDLLPTVDVFKVRRSRTTFAMERDNTLLFSVL